jgi:hypothetical protein
VYVDWLDEALDVARWPTLDGSAGTTLRLEYLASAERGDDVEVELRGQPGSWSALIRRSGGLDHVRASGTSAA